MGYLNIRTEKCPVCGRKPIIKAKSDEFTLDFDGSVEVSCKRPFRHPHLQVFANHEDLCTAISMAVTAWNYEAACTQHQSRRNRESDQ